MFYISKQLSVLDIDVDIPESISVNYGHVQPPRPVTGYWDEVQQEQNK